MSRAFLEDGREAKGDVARLFLSPDLQLGQSDLKKVRMMMMMMMMMVVVVVVVVVVVGGGVGG